MAMMRPLTRFETSVVTSLSVAGLGVTLTAALAEKLDVPPAQKLETGTSDVDVEITLPSIPKSKEEFLQSWAERYVQNKAMLSKAFRFAGQMFAAPIAVLFIDAAYQAYCEQCSETAKLSSATA